MGVRRAVRRLVVILAVGALVAAACSEKEKSASDKSTSSSRSGTTTTTQPKATGDPVLVGLINQEDTPAGSFPEIRVAAQTAVEYVNNELGGASGHPMELEVCKTAGTPESTQSCANKLVEAGVKVVIVGEDFQMSSAYPILQEAGLAVVGIAPVTMADFIAANAYYFSGGSVTNLFALVKFMGEYLDVKKTVVLYQDDAAGQAAIPLVTPALAKLGIEHVDIGEKPDAPDYTPAVAAAMESNPDALLVLFGPQGCAGIMKAKESLGFDVPIVTTGACYDKTVLESAGAGVNGTYFSLGPDPDDPESNPDVPIYRAVMDKYAPDEEWRGLAGAGFSDVMSLWEVLDGIGFDNLTPASITEALKTTKGGHLFMGEPWTCGTIPTFPSVCETHVRIYRYEDGKLTDATDGKWIDGTDLIG